MNKLVLLSLMLSASFAATACYRYQTMSVGPFFIESDGTLASYQPIQQINRNIEMQDAELKAEEHAFEDSIMGLYDSSSVQTEEKKELVELLNLERQVHVLKKRDSIARHTQLDLRTALVQFNRDAADFCERNSVPVLFSSNNNTIVFGLNTRADLSGKMKAFLGGAGE